MNLCRSTSHPLLNPLSKAVSTHHRCCRVSVFHPNFRRLKIPVPWCSLRYKPLFSRDLLLRNRSSFSEPLHRCAVQIKLTLRCYSQLVTSKQHTDPTKIVILTDKISETILRRSRGVTQLPVVGATVIYWTTIRILSLQ